MADLDSRWNQNIDKIAYGVAILLGFIVLCIPLLAGGSADTNGLDSAITELSRAIGKQQLPEYVAPKVKEAAVQQWTAGPAAPQDPTWRTEVAPLVLLESEKVSDTPCVHEASEIVELRCERDPQAKIKKAAIVIKGKPSEKNSNVVIKKMELQRKADGGTEDFRTVPDFKATAELEFRDVTVEAGKVYTYRLVSVADRDPQLPKQFVFDTAKDGTKTSAEVTASGPVPYEFSLVPTGFDQQDPTVPRFFGKLLYWDYAKGAVTDLGSKLFAEKEEFADRRFAILTVDAPGQKVVVREPAGEPGKNRWEFTLKSLPRAVKPFDAVIPGAPAPEPEAPAVDPKKAAKDAKATKTAAPPKTAPKDKKTDKKEPDKKDTKKKKGFAK